MKEIESSAAVREMTLSQLPHFIEMKEIQDVVDSHSLGDETSETTLDALANFNDEMKILALNAY